MIPGLEDVEFLRMGSIHRNTYVNALKFWTKSWPSKLTRAFILPDRLPGLKATLNPQPVVSG